VFSNLQQLKQQIVQN
jgi:hypothetical protein